MNFFLLIGSNQIKFMTYQLGQRKEFPPLLIRLHQLLQPISKSRKSYLKDTTDFINYIFLKKVNNRTFHVSVDVTSLGKYATKRG